MAKAMEKSAVRKLSAAQFQKGPRGKGKAVRPVASRSGAASKVIKVIKVVPAPKAVSAVKKGASIRPASAPTAVGPGRPARPVVAAVAPVAAMARVESARINGSEHGAAVSRTDHLKARFAALSSASAQIKALKRALLKNFFDIGVLLEKIRVEKLYEVKGYGSFESFVEREVDLDKVLCLRLARLSAALVRSVALEVGLERAAAAMAALDGGVAPASPVAVYPVNATVSSSLPAHKR